MSTYMYVYTHRNNNYGTEILMKYKQVHVQHVLLIYSDMYYNYMKT